MYVTPAFFRKRMELLVSEGYNVLPLGAAVRQLYDGTLPARSVAITFDDGFHDFHQEAFPVLRSLRLPATVYQTTYYCDYPVPIFNLALSYLFWRAGKREFDARGFGLDCTFRLPEESALAVNAFLQLCGERGYTPERRDEIAAEVAPVMGCDYDEIRRLGMLQLMTAGQLTEIADAGIDIQLHTHRHRTPMDRELFVREIRDNRQWLERSIGRPVEHFCYPSGVHHPNFLPWLRSEGVLSATTCDYGLAWAGGDPLLMPRLLDAMNITDENFHGWLSGVSSFLPHRRVHSVVLNG